MTTMSFRRIFNLIGLKSLNFRFASYNSIPRGVGTWITVTTTSSFYCFGASGIEPINNNNNDNDKPKRRLKRRKKKAKPVSAASPSRVDRINGHYQNRIRQMSTPEKIFSTFASTVNKQSGQQMMTFNDFREAILPYDFRNESAAANMKNKNIGGINEDIPSFLNGLILGQNKNKNKKFSINLSEFILITSLLSIPPSDFEFVFKIFDLNENGKMDANEFKSLLEHFKQKNTSNYDVTDDNIIKKTNIWKYLFEMNQEKELTLSQFQQFLLNLRESVLRIEYERYTGNVNHKLSPKNFGMSLVSYAHHSDVPYYVARVNRIPKKRFNKQQYSITYQEFVDFNKCLYSIKDIMRALNYYAAGKENISQKAFQHTVKCITGIDLNKNLIAILFWVLDRDGDNALDQTEISALFTERFHYGQATDRLFLGSFVKCFRQCCR